MKNITKINYALTVIITLFLVACGGKASQSTTTQESNANLPGQSGVVDDISNPNIVQVASKSADHSTLVAAIKAASLVDALSNAGPFTVFAPTNAAFDKLPKGTLENLLKPESKATLIDILGYHTYVGVLKTDYMEDGQKFDMVNSKKVTITKKDGKIFVNGSPIIASVPTSNGIIYVIEDVLLPE